MKNLQARLSLRDWIQYLFGVTKKQRGRRRSRRNVPALRCESLEDRTLLDGQPITGFGGLTFDPGRYDSSSLLVRFRDDSTALIGSQFLAGTQIEPGWSVAPGLHQVRLAPGVSVLSALEAYRSNPAVLYAEPDYIIQIDSTPNDPSFPQMWALNNTGQTGGTPDADIDAPAAWDITTGSGNTIVAVIDTGIDYRHPDLAANMWVNAAEFNGSPGVDDDHDGYVDDIYGYDFENRDGNPLDDNNHGTHVAGTIGAVGNNGVGLTGINWRVKLMALKFLDENGSGTTSHAIEALNFAVAHGATISNNSYGGDPFSQAFHDAIANARAAGHIFVAASGNGNFLGIGLDNDVEPFYPASENLDNVVAVAATDHNDRLAVFSNYGATSVDLAAPGVNILSTTRNNTYGVSSGTSMAAPHVTGAIALLRDLHPEWTYQQVIARILGTVDPLPDLQGKVVTGGRLNLAAAVTPDAAGPMIISSGPFAAVSGSVNKLRVTFNEAVQASTFTTADIVSFIGPNGTIGVTGVSMVAGSANRKFDISFASQSVLGNYTLVLGPAISDISGNLMNQDGDAVNGEAVQDRYTAGFQIVPFAAKFDFGVAGSPVADGYTGVVPTTSFNAAQGYGWLSGPIQAVDRGAALGNDLTRDMAFERQLNFGVAAPQATYDVTLTIGDVGPFAHDLIGVFLEGSQVDTINTAAGQVLNLTYRVPVKDGQLTLSLRDLGGSDANVVLSGLQVAWAGPSGPRVISAAPSGTVMGPTDRVSLTFDEAIQDGTFTLADVVSLSGPGGAITPTAVIKLSSTRYDVTFASQSATGDYALTIGPNIVDLTGHAMDQNGNGTPGEAILDRFTNTFRIVPFVGHFDFGVSGSPVASAYTGVTPTTSYSGAAGYGWLGGAVQGVDRGTGADLTRDLNYANQLTFGVDVPEATYEVTLTIGDAGPFAHDQMAVFLEGVQVGTVNTAAGQVMTLTFRTPVKDGQLTVFLQDQGGIDPNVVINGLDVVWVGPAGPRVISATPTGSVFAQTDCVTLTFDEAIQDGSFTLADIDSLNGPGGVITPTAVNKLSATRYEVVFAPQSAAGTYTLTIGPSILDLGGFEMDQDGDGIPGETTDRFTTTFQLVSSLGFDFGVIGSPVASGYTGVVPSTSYNAALGFGWLSGPVQAVDRGTANPLTRDLAFERQLNFGMDVPEGTYDVVLTIGDTGSFTHDLMGVFLEGNQVDTINTAAGQVLTMTYRVPVKDGQVTLSLRDLGGSDVNVVLNGLQVVWVGPAGPRVIAAAPSVAVMGPVDRVTVTFDEAIQDGTFTLDDVASLSGPSGAITPVAVNKLSSTRYEVTFAAQTVTGDYALTVGPNILDLSSYAMDQNSNGTPGETLLDRYTATFRMAPFVGHFDFGVTGSPVASGYIGVTPTTSYSSATGYGWLGGFVQGVDRGTGTDLTRDLVFANQLNFAVDVPDGTYDVTLTLGDVGPFVHDQMRVSLEGTQVATLNTAAGQVTTVTYRAAVKDGQLTLLLQDLGGIDPNVVLNGLDVIWIGPAGPRVIAVSPSAAVVGQVDRVRVTFDEAIQDGSFTLADVNSVTGPAGVITPISVDKVSATVYDVRFAAQSAAGVYTLSIGPDILDLAGNVMDQNGNGTPGEASGDRFSSAFQLALSMSFDFGVAGSPVAAGFIGVTPTTSYSTALGYGWFGGPVQAVDRNNGTALTRDLAYERQLNFAVDAADGVYDVTLTIGDAGPFAHDLMGVFLEGGQVDTISTAAGQVLTVTYRGSVTDGQLTLSLVDLGGSDVNVVINGLQIVWVGQGGSSIPPPGLGGAMTPPGANKFAAVFSEMLFPVPSTAIDPNHFDLFGATGVFRLPVASQRKMLQTIKYNAAQAYGWLFSQMQTTDQEADSLTSGRGLDRLPTPKRRS